MKFTQSSARIFIPDGCDLQQAFRRTTHLAIAAHQDDQEFLAYHGIAACFRQPEQWFTGVVVTDGRGGPRHGFYAEYTDEELTRVRQQEQEKAAIVGEYSVQIQLNFSSQAVKRAPAEPVVGDLIRILHATRPRVIYTHNPADRHDTHVAVTLQLIEALHRLKSEYSPDIFYGVEIWRDLDWAPESQKVALDVSAYPELSQALIGVYHSQISGAKRYDLAIPGRRLAHATLRNSHAVDDAPAIAYALNLMPLLTEPPITVVRFIESLVDTFRTEMQTQLKRLQS